MARRKLTAEERDLWRKVQETVTPLAAPAAPLAAPEPRPSPPGRPDAATSDAGRPGTGRASGRSSGLSPVGSSARPAAGPAAHGAALEPRLRRRLARGARDVDARIDLHGLRQAQARAVLERFLIEARARDDRLVLVITGKGRGEAAGAGVLRGAVPRWLALPAFRHMVVGFEEAGRRHGGAGAFYVRLRRSRGAA